MSIPFFVFSTILFRHQLIGSIMADFRNLKRIVKKLTGRDATSLTKDEAVHTKELHPEEYAQYVALKKEFNKAWQQARAAYVAAKGKKGLVPYQDLEKYLASQGFKDVITSGFTGLVNAKGQLFTPKGALIAGVPSVVMFPQVVMNTTNSGDWVFYVVKVDGTKGNYFYTEAVRKANAHEKFAKVLELGPKLPGIRAKWFAHVKKFDPSDDLSVACVVLEILYQFSARIGTPRNATLGISTLLVRNLTETPQGITIKYKGKDSVLTTHKLVNTDPAHKYVIKALKILMDDKDPKDPVFTVTKDSGRRTTVLPTTVNKAFKTFGAGDVGVHKMRTVAGTELFVNEFATILNGPKRPKNAKEAMDAYKTVALKVGKLLNHVRRTGDGVKITGMTALTSYIDPQAQLAVFLELGVPIPPHLQKNL